VPSYSSRNFSSVSHLSSKSGYLTNTIYLYLVPETTYFRGGLVTNNNTERSDSASGESKILDVFPDKEKGSARTVSYRKKPYLQNLKVYNGVYPTKASFWKLLLRPFVACLTPVCLWACLLYGTAVSWLAMIATSVSQNFSAPREDFVRLTSNSCLNVSQHILLILLISV